MNRIRSRSTRLFASLCVACLLGTAAIATASSITDFRIYGVNSVVIGVNSNVLSGKVGSNTQITTNSGSDSFFADDFVSGGGVRLQGDNQLQRNIFAAGEVRISDPDTNIGGTIDANIIDLTGAGGNGVDIHGHATANSFIAPANGNFLGGMTIGTPTPPDLPVFPAATIFSAGGPDVHDPVAPLLPGVYGLVESNINNRDILLSAGDYYMDSLAISSGALLKFDVTGGPIRMFIVGNASLPNQHVAIVGGDSTDVFVEVHGDWQQTGSGTWNGTIFAPNGLIHIGSGSSQFTYNGYAWAADVDIEHAVNLDGQVPEPASVVLLLIFAGLAANHRHRACDRLEMRRT